MGESNFFYEGARTVKNFIKAKLNIPSRKAGKVEDPDFRVVGKIPDTSVDWKSPPHEFNKK